MARLDHVSIKGKKLKDLLPEETLSSLQIAYFSKGDVVALVGQDAPHLYIILSGRAVIKQLGSEGQETVLGYVQHGDLIGELEIYTKNCFLHYVYADTDLELLCIPSQRALTDLFCHIPFLHFVMEGTFTKLLNRTTHYSDTRLYGHKARTLGYIKDLRIRHDSNTIPFVIREVAPFIGVSDRQLRRIIKELERKEIVRKKYKVLEIIDVDYLLKNEKESDV
ncbi:Crp/Fnr family transcriptional regulator [Streptococcus cameli]